MKTCNTCHEEKQLSEFQVRSKNKDGRTSMCKLCKRSYDNNHYKTHPERRSYIRSNAETRIQENKDWITEYLRQNSCVDCSEDDIVVLEFDHRGDKLYNIASMITSHSLNRIREEVAKCDVRCANCHRRKTANQFGWWRTLINNGSVAQSGRVLG